MTPASNGPIRCGSYLLRNGCCPIGGASYFLTVPHNPPAPDDSDGVPCVTFRLLMFSGDLSRTSNLIIHSAHLFFVLLHDNSALQGATEASHIPHL